MTRAALSTLLLALAVGSLVAPSGARAARPDDVCRSGRLGRTVAVAGDVSVRARHGVYFACVRGRAAAYLESTAGYDTRPTLRPFRIVGDWVAWALIVHGRDSYAAAGLCNVRDHRGLLAAPSNLAGLNDIRTVAVTSSGALAFSAVDQEHPNTSREIVVVDGAGRRQVASGAAVDLGSLAIARAGAFWWQDGAARYAALSGTGARPSSDTERHCERPARSWRV